MVLVTLGWGQPAGVGRPEHHSPSDSPGPSEHRRGGSQPAGSWRSSECTHPTSSQLNCVLENPVLCSAVSNDEGCSQHPAMSWLRVAPGFSQLVSLMRSWVSYQAHEPQKLSYRATVNWFVLLGQNSQGCSAFPTFFNTVSCPFPFLSYKTHSLGCSSSSSSAAEDSFSYFQYGSAQPTHLSVSV